MKRIKVPLSAQNKPGNLMHSYNTNISVQMFWPVHKTSYPINANQTHIEQKKGEQKKHNSRSIQFFMQTQTNKGGEKIERKYKFQREKKTVPS